MEVPSSLSSCPSRSPFIPLFPPPPGPCLMSKLFCSVSRPGAQCDIYGFLLGPCVEPAIILERERERERGEREREKSPLPSFQSADTSLKCSSHGCQAAANDDNDDDDDDGDGGEGGDDTRIRVQHFWNCFSPSSFFRKENVYAWYIKRKG